MSGGGKDNRVQETEQQREVARVAAEKWNFYQEKFAPIENWYIEKVANMNTAGEYLKAAGVGNVEAQMQLGKGINALGQADVNSPRFEAGVNNIEQVGGTVAGSNAARGIMGQQNRFVQGMGNVAAMGMGRGTQAQSGLMDLANSANKNAVSDAEEAFNERMGNLKLAGTALGLGASIYGADQAAQFDQQARTQSQAPSLSYNSYGPNPYAQDYGTGGQFFRKDPWAVNS